MDPFQFCVQREVTRVSAWRCLSSQRPASFQLLTFKKIQTRVFASITISCQTLHSFPGMPINLINVLSFVPLALSKQLNSILLTSLTVALTLASEKCVLLAAMKRLPARLKLALRRWGHHAQVKTNGRQWKTLTQGLSFYEEKSLRTCIICSCIMPIFRFSGCGCVIY